MTYSVGFRTINHMQHSTGLGWRLPPTPGYTEEEAHKECIRINLALGHSANDDGVRFSGDCDLMADYDWTEPLCESCKGRGTIATHGEYGQGERETCESCKGHGTVAAHV